ENAETVAKRCFLFEKFVDDLLAQDPNALRFETRPATVAIHPHCHAKSIMNPAFMKRLAERLPGRKATLLDTGCCGMAGAFGALAEKYDLSIQVAADLLDKIDNQPPGTEIVASGTSFRHQIVDLIPQPRGTRPKHIAELLAEAIACSRTRKRRLQRDNWRFDVKNRCDSNETDPLVSPRAEESSQTR